MKQQVVVIGLGRFGSAVATELVRLGHEVLGIDTNMDTVQAMANSLSSVVQAEGTDEETLARLGIAEFDVGVVGISSDLETSILTTLLLKRLGVKRVIVKARNDTHGEILDRVGADRVVYPERDTGLRLAHSWTSFDVTDSLDVVEGYAVSRVTVPPELVGQTVKRAVLDRNFQVTLLLLARGERVTVYPSGSEVIREDDILVIGGELPEMERFFAAIHGH
ncbi:MAG: TrkA family potassium uptake protein [Chloroflexi bacterium]|nr:TrkA family potassium uptake protein [Chloroflexota bacterium]